MYKCNKTKYKNANTQNHHHFHVFRYYFFSGCNRKNAKYRFLFRTWKRNVKITLSPPFFCGEASLAKIQAIRGTEYPTKYIVKEWREYDYVQQNWDKINENRKKSVKYQNKHLKSTVSYYLLTVFKFIAIKIAKDENIFNSSHFAWVDLGCNYICRNMREYASSIVENPRPKVTVMYIHYRSKKELEDMKHYMEYGNMCGIAANMFTVEKEYVDRFYHAMFFIFHEMTEKGVGHFEEQILTYGYDRYPELFELYYGDYYSVFQNYHASIADIPSIERWFINICLESNREDLAENARRSIK